MGNLRLAGILGLLLLLVFLGGPAESQGLDVRGVVTGKDGSPRGGASIDLKGMKQYIATSNPRGEFFLSGVVPGDYTAIVIQGNKRHISRVTISTGAPLNLTVPW
jgi:hypothetical protein